MKKLVFWAVLIAVALLSVSCKGKKDKDKLPQGEVHVSQYAPIPSFKEVFRTLDELKVKDVSVSLPTTVYKTKQEEARNAFALGLLTADAVLAAKGRNKAKLVDISTQMMNLTPLLKLEDEINQLGDNMKTLIEQEKWSELDATLDQIEQSVKDKLWDMENYENYTLMILGGWSEAANRVAWLIKQDYAPEKTVILAQEGTWNSLVANLELVTSEHIINNPGYKESLPLAKEIQAIIKAHKDRTYTSEQLDQIIAATDKIKAAFQK